MVYFLIGKFSVVFTQKKGERKDVPLFSTAKKRSQFDISFNFNVSKAFPCHMLVSARTGKMDELIK